MEANIRINDRVLTASESMVVRVAIESFAMFLHNKGLGEDEIGQEMTKLYLINIDLIRSALYGQKKHMDKF